jgi:hypothetical protein
MRRLPIVWRWFTTRRNLLITTVVVAVCLTAALVLSGALTSASQVTAYATVLLAIGTVGLAVGAIGTYVEQRKTNQQQESQLAQQKIADMAQVIVDRISGPSEFLQVIVVNGSKRAIREVYVWADVLGKGFYPAAVQREGGGMARGMRNIEHQSRDYWQSVDLAWQFRVIRPGEQEKFTQLTKISDEPISATDPYVTAFVQFTDSDGDWWRCSEDGFVARVNPAPQEPPSGPLELPEPPPADFDGPVWPPIRTDLP